MYGHTIYTINIKLMWVLDRLQFDRCVNLYDVCCFCMMCVICVLCLIVVPLPPGENPFAVQYKYTY
jgi:hypothetical protein